MLGVTFKKVCPWKPARQVVGQLQGARQGLCSGLTVSFRKAKYLMNAKPSIWSHVDGCLTADSVNQLKFDTEIFITLVDKVSR